MTHEREFVLLGDASDEALVRLILEGGAEDAFRTLYRRYTPRLFRVAVRMLGAEADAEDVVQEAWLRAVPRLRGFEWRSALGTWLTAITVNLARDVLDRRGRWRMMEIDDLDLGFASHDQPDAIDLERAIAALPPGCRTVFVLHDVEGFTHEEIAEQLGCSPGTSKSQVFRARRALRRVLGGAVVEGPSNGS
jgi:RNA polymerase sigma-70 factor, ECF subfamily